MATVITKECINCGACEPECPNVAIYAGGIEYESGSEKHAALSDEFFYIVPSKCTECVGFHDHEACAAVCPVDCCIPDPAIVEDEALLLERARVLHPERVFGDDFPSRFRNRRRESSVKLNTAASNPAIAETLRALPGAEDLPKRPAILGPLPVEQEPSTPVVSSTGTEKPKRAAAVDEAGVATPPSDALHTTTTPEAPKAASANTTPAAPKASPAIEASNTTATPAAPKASPVPDASNAAPAASKPIAPKPVPPKPAPVAPAKTEAPATEAPATAAPAAVEEAAQVASPEPAPFRGGHPGVPSADDLAGPFDALLETLRPRRRGLARLPLLGRWFAARSNSRASGVVPHDGFLSGSHESKRERERRYGEVYEVEEWSDGLYLRMELPRRIPVSQARDRLALGDEMPDYDIALEATKEGLRVRGSVVDDRLRSLCGVSPSFPADFLTVIPVEGAIHGLCRRYGDKVLEVVVLKEPR